MEWPADLASVSRQLGVKDTNIYENSFPGIFENQIFLAARIYYGVKRVFSLFRGPNITKSRVRNVLLQYWFAGIARKKNVDLVVVSYTYWSDIVEKIPVKIIRVMELMDLIPIYQHLVTEVSRQIISKDGCVELIPEPDDLGYVSSVGQLPPIVIESLRCNILELDKYNLIWSISERETNIVREINPAFRIDTIYPRIANQGDTLKNHDYALMPTGPNIFNTYSILRFFKYIKPFVVYPSEDAKILITGFSLANSKFTLPEGVKNLGSVDDYLSVLKRARFFIVATSVGTGQQLKIFEALSNGIPVVCFKIALPEEMQKASLGIVSVDNDRDFAEAVSKMWNDEEYYQRIKSELNGFVQFMSNRPGYRQSVEKFVEKQARL